MQTRILKFLISQSILIVCILLFVVSSLVSDVFLTPGNLSNIAKQIVPLAMVSFGMLVVILTGGIDLSVGSIMAVASVFFGVFFHTYGVGFGPSVAVGLLAAAAMGLISGTAIAVFALPPFVATLAVMTIARGVAFIYSGGYSQLIFNDTLEFVGSGQVLGVPVIVVIGSGFFLFFLYMQRRSSFARILKAIGSNEAAVHLSGIRVAPYKLAAYVISGVMAGVAGILVTARTSNMAPNMGEAWELDAIAAVVIGGASLSGGRGRVFEVLLGVIILGLLRNILNLMNVPGFYQLVIKGAIIILAVLIYSGQLQAVLRQLRRH